MMELFLVKKNVSIDTHIVGVFSNRDLAMTACHEDFDLSDQSDSVVISYLLEKYSLDVSISCDEKVRYSMDYIPGENSWSQIIINRSTGDLVFNDKENIEKL